MAARSRRPVALIVLDGWGHRPEREGNAIALARTPSWDALWSSPSRTLLEASGLRVGLPEGQIGNSEVGHLNLGAGRVVMQDLVRISQSIRDRTFFDNDAFVSACKVCSTERTLHLVGLIGAGGVHAIDEHLFALVDLAERAGLHRVAIHALLDGRDTLPKSGLGYMQELLTRTKGRAYVASVGGRYYGMDRDQRWDRTKLWYDAAVLGRGPTATDPTEVIRAAYDRGETDEFIKPVCIVGADGAPVGPMRDGDSVICFNYRADRMRQIVRALTDPQFAGFDVSARPKLHVTTMTSYDRTFGVPVAFPPQSMARILAETLAEHDLCQLRTAETEKYAHVTYFFNGGVEAAVACEHRALVPSRKDVATYDLAPAMSAPEITDVLVTALASREHDFILCNYANGDMVGHSGSLPATIAACEVVDASLTRIIAASQASKTRLLVTADHGNCEMMIDPVTGGPHTAHTTNPVPLVVLDPDGDRPLRGGGALCDVAPTILGMLGVEQPAEMTGRDLRVV